MSILTKSFKFMIVSYFLLTPMVVFSNQNTVAIENIKKSIERFENEQFPFDAKLSENSITLEMPTCNEPTYVYLHYGSKNAHQRILLTSDHNQKTIQFIEQEDHPHPMSNNNVLIEIGLKEDVDHYLDCLKKQLEFYQEQPDDILDTTTTTRSTIESMQCNIPKFQYAPFNKTIKEMETIKTIKLSSYQELQEKMNEQQQKNTALRKKNRTKQVTLTIPEQTIQLAVEIE